MANFDGVKRGEPHPSLLPSLLVASQHLSSCRSWVHSSPRRMIHPTRCFHWPMGDVSATQYYEVRGSKG